MDLPLHVNWCLFKLLCSVNVELHLSQCLSFTCTTFLGLMCILWMCFFKLPFNIDLYSQFGQSNSLFSLITFSVLCSIKEPLLVWIKFSEWYFRKCFSKYDFLTNWWSQKLQISFGEWISLCLAKDSSFAKTLSHPSLSHLSFSACAFSVCLFMSKILSEL